MTIVITLAISSGQAPRQVQESVLVKSIDLVSLVPRPVVLVKCKVSRSKPGIERRVMTVSAYCKDDPGMDGKGITASGEMVREGRTIAADWNVPFGTEIHIPQLGTFVVTDRGGAITDGRLDLYVEKREDALAFGVRELEVFIKY